MAATPRMRQARKIRKALAKPPRKLAARQSERRPQGSFGCGLKLAFARNPPVAQTHDAAHNVPPIPAHGVTRTSVAPCRAFRSNSKSMIARPRSPHQGCRSAHPPARISGRGAAARARATRCCSPPGHFGRVMIQPRLPRPTATSSARARSKASRTRLPVPGASRHVLQGPSSWGTRWKDWKDHAHMLPAPRRASASSPKAVRSWPSRLNLTPRGALKPAHQHKERRFARPRRPDKPQEFRPPCDVQGDALQDFHRTLRCRRVSRRASFIERHGIVSVIAGSF